jgi:hypothetical protein
MKDLLFESTYGRPDYRKGAIFVASPRPRAQPLGRDDSRLWNAKIERDAAQLERERAAHEEQHPLEEAARGPQGI